MSKKRNVYLKAVPMRAGSGGTSGRIKYITSPEEQEFLEAVFYSKDDPTFWKELREYCERAAREAGHDTFSDGREHHGMLDNRLAEMYTPSELCKRISDFYKKHTGTENVVAIHWNKSHTNYHFHVVFAENKEINEVHYGAVLRQNTYYNAQGQKINKRDALDPNTKKLLPGCTMIKKGERKETIKRFGPKNLQLADTVWMADMKKKYAEFQNKLLNEKQFKVFKDDGLHIAQQHVGNNIQDEVLRKEIESKNKMIQQYNDKVDSILDLSSELNKHHPEIHEKWVDKLKDFRNSLKKIVKTKGYDSWKKALNNLVERLKELLRGMEEEMDKRKRIAAKMAEKAQNEPNTRASLNERLQDIEVRKGVDVPKQQPFRKKRHDLER